MMRAGIVAVVLAASIYAAHGFGLGERSLFGRLGAMSKSAGAAPASGCASPTAPNGVFDFSLCSNAAYTAVVF